MTNKRISFVAAALLSLAIAFPSLVAAQNYPDSVKQYVANTRKQIKTVGMPAFKAVYDAKLSSAVIVDVREPEEYAAGYVPGAVNVPRGLLEFTIWEHVGFPDKTDMNTKMTLYCATGGRCALATKSLQDLGFTNVTSADMRFDDWVKAGYPVAMPKK